MIPMVSSSIFNENQTVLQCMLVGMPFNQL